MESLIRNAVCVLAFIILALIGLPVLLFCASLGLRETFMAYGRWMMKVGRAVLGVDVDAEGLEHLDPAAPYVFMANHASFLDGPLLVTVLDRPLRAIVKRFVFRIPVLGWGMRFVGYVPIDKEGVGEGRLRIAHAARLVKEKRYSFLVFPEGTRSPDGGLQPFRRGGFYLALMTKAAIVPVSIKGTHWLMPRGRLGVRQGHVRIAFREPIEVGGLSEEALPALMIRVRASVASGL